MLVGLKHRCGGDGGLQRGEGGGSNDNSQFSQFEPFKERNEERLRDEEVKKRGSAPGGGGGRRIPKTTEVDPPLLPWNMVEEREEGEGGIKRASQ